MKKAIFMTLSCLLLAVCLYPATREEWLWGRQVQGPNTSYGRAIVTDSEGYSYIAGNFNGTLQLNGVPLRSTGNRSILIAKIDSDGNWVWAKSVDGTGDDRGYGIALDKRGNIYVTGEFSGTANFDDIRLVSSGQKDLFVAKLDSDGNYFWVARGVGQNHNHSWDVVVADDDNIYITGFFRDSVSFGGFTLVAAGARDIFIAKLDNEGNWLWALQGQSPEELFSRSITTDSHGNAYITGQFYDTCRFGDIELTANGMSDIFIAKADAAGNWLWARQAGGENDDSGYGIGVDSDDNVYVTGWYGQNAHFGDTHLHNNAFYDNVFMAKLDSHGNWLWARGCGTPGFEYGYDLTIGDDNNAYVTGFYRQDPENNNDFDIFVAAVDQRGNWIWYRTGNGTGSDYAWGVSVDGQGNIYVVGDFSREVYLGDSYLTNQGNNQVFTAKISTLQTNIEPSDTITPAITQLYGNYPNPFNPETVISYSLAEDSAVELIIYNLLGQTVRTLYSGEQQAGQHSLVWNGKSDRGDDVASGVYFYRLKTSGFSQARKMLLLR